MKKTTQLRNLIYSSELSFIMEAHNGLSARIAEEAGFKAIWGSGLSIAASLGVRDNNEASWTQVVDILEFMSDATKIPILVDGDTGHGNFNNVRRFVQKLGQRGIAGVCLEDKLFPKTNSFIGGEKQQLADVDEFCGKIKAGKDAQIDSDFIIVARLEAFIAGWGLSEALTRAHAYVAAGADAILVHSKKNSAVDIQAFMKEWDHSAPIVVVPTKYFTTPTEYFQDLGIQAVIWANHSMRAATSAMQAVTKRIFADNSVINVEGSISPLSEIFRLQDSEELTVAEKSYLPNKQNQHNAIILAASRGSEFGKLTEDMPKALLKVGNSSIINHITEAFRHNNIKDISVVRGYKKDSFKQTDIKFYDNDEYAHTKEVASLYCARQAITNGTIISFGDILFKEYFISELLSSEAPITIVSTPNISSSDRYKDLIKTAAPYSVKTFNELGILQKMSNELTKTEATGEFVGLWHVQNEGVEHLLETLNFFKSGDNFTQARLSDLFMALLERTSIAVKYLEGGWVDIDTVPELIEASHL